MSTPRFVLAVALSAALLLVAAACGGKSTRAKAPTVPTTSSAATPAEQRAQVKSNWERFFSGKTSASQKAGLLQNGRALAKAIGAQASSPLAKQSSAKVTSVTLAGPSKATVVYTIYLGGKPALAHQKGTAVKIGGKWKVGLASFCKLLRLQGAPPAACAQAR
ncbi:MAG TPA: hypothetical protein VE982_07380 [Gaiellaceae bacterium]|nr:hypothetical protein [Gaiellaceae bacterium]